MSETNTGLTKRNRKRWALPVLLLLLAVGAGCSGGGGGGGGSTAPGGGVGEPCQSSDQCETGLYCFEGAADLAGLCTMNCFVPEGADDPCALKYPNTACLVAGVCGLQCGSGLVCPQGTICDENAICSH
jgi:hypothetical protein